MANRSGTSDLAGRVTDLFHYPVKGLSAQMLENVDLAPGQGFPFDRVFAFARRGSGYDADRFRPLPKNRFLVLMTEADLARLTTHYDETTGRLFIDRGEQRLLEAVLSEPDGAHDAEIVLREHLGLDATDRPTLAVGGNNRFTDISVVSPEMMNAVSLINLASVRDLAARTGHRIDPMRFRANIYFDGWPSWSELDLVGSEVSIGPVRLRICLRTRRCPATQVNPATARRDLDVPDLLAANLGHSDMGVYAEVITGGRIAPGAAILA